MEPFSSKSGSSKYSGVLSWWYLLCGLWTRLLLRCRIMSAIPWVFFLFSFLTFLPYPLNFPFSRSSLHPSDRSENNCYLYGVFNGYEGNRTTNFVGERLSAELLLGQLNADHDDADVRRILLQVTGLSLWRNQTEICVPFLLYHRAAAFIEHGRKSTLVWKL